MPPDGGVEPCRFLLQPFREPCIHPRQRVANLGDDGVNPVHALTLCGNDARPFPVKPTANFLGSPEKLHVCAQLQVRKSQLNQTPSALGIPGRRIGRANSPPLLI